MHHLKTARREEVAQKLEIAIKQGDLKENADYHDAKESKASSKPICELEDHADERPGHREQAGRVVRIGSTVTVSEEGYDELETYTIVGVAEAID